MYGSYYSLRSLEVIANSLFVVYLAIKHMALTSELAKVLIQIY